MRKKCRHLETRVKETISKWGEVFYNNEYKCNIKGGNHETAMKKVCKECPLQLNLF